MVQIKVVKLDFVRALNKYYTPGEVRRVKIGIFTEFREKVDIDAGVWSFSARFSGPGSESGSVSASGNHLTIKFPSVEGEYRIHVDGCFNATEERSNLFIVSSVTSDVLEVVSSRPLSNPLQLSVYRFYSYSCDDSCDDSTRSVGIREEFGTTLGAHVWDSAVIVLRNIQRCMDACLPPRAHESDDKKGFRALELGAGCGLVSIALAQTGLFELIVATDKAPQIDLLERNIASNNCSNLAVALPLDWAEPSDLSRLASKYGCYYDLYIAADVLYDVEAAEHLFALLLGLSSSSPSTRAPPVILAQKIRLDSHRKAIDLTKLRAFSVEKLAEEADVVIWKLVSVM
jgi:predicted nicotinamide N-methyase